MFTDYNYAALVVSIFKGTTPEQSLAIIEGYPSRWIPITDNEIEDIIAIKKSNKRITYAQLGDIYGLSSNAIFVRIKRYLKRRRESQMKQA